MGVIAAFYRFIDTASVLAVIAAAIGIGTIIYMIWKN